MLNSVKYLLLQDWPEFNYRSDVSLFEIPPSFNVQSSKKIDFCNLRYFGGDILPEKNFF